MPGSNQGTATYTIQDYSREKAHSSMNVGIVTALSLPNLLTNLGNFEKALDNIIIGTVFKKSLSVYDNATNNGIPTNVFAQREIRWVVHYHDNTPAFGVVDSSGNPITGVPDVPNPAFGRAYTVEYACPDLSLLQQNSDLMDLSTSGGPANGKGAAFVLQFENTFLAPSGGVARIDYIELVGRKG